MNAKANQILLLGMHRSGTSAIARVIGLMGAWIGESESLLEAHPTDNPTGYWERHDVILAHHDFLMAAGYEWDTLAHFRPEGTANAHKAALRDRLRPIIDEFDKHSPWLLKDPRLCLLLPLWQPLLKTPVHVVAVRSPGKIAASLHDGPRGIYPTHFLLALWEKYLRSALEALNGQPALFVSYERLLAAPEAESKRIRYALRNLGVSGLHAPKPYKMNAFLNVNLQRSRVIAHTPFNSAQASLYAWLQAQCVAPGAVQVEDFPLAPVPDATLFEYEMAIRHARQQVAIQVAEKMAIQTQEQLQVKSLAYSQQLAQLQSELTATQAQQLAQLQSEWAAAHAQQLAQLQSEWAAAHAQQLTQFQSEWQDSTIWRVTKNKVKKLFRPRISFSIEQGLYRFFYSLPGMSPAHKRAFVIWVHQHLPWVTRHTLSYQLYQSAKALRRQPGTSTTRQPRMDNVQADAILESLSHTPLISIVMPVYNVERRWLLMAVESVRRQFYPHWQLCIVDDASTNSETHAALNEISKMHERRIKITRLESNTGIAECSNAALALATGDYVGLLDHDDELTSDALLEVAQQIVATQPDLIYSDEDKLDELGEHVEVHCKPDFNPDYFFSINYLCHFAVIRREHLQQIGGFRSGFDGAQDYDLLLRASEQTNKIVHIPKVLYHWRKIANSTASISMAKPQTTDAGRRALVESMQRRGIDSQVELGPYPNTYRVRRTLLGEPLVSILIPFREKPELLEACVSSILEKTRYGRYEIICIDNDSIKSVTHATIRRLKQRDQRVRFLRYEAPFNYSAINNFGARQARGQHLLFLNNDTEIISHEWLDSMLEHSQRLEVGVVGSRLLYADGTTQHAGVIVGLGGVAGHAHLFLPGDHPGYFARAQLIQNLSAVTFACAMTRRDIFEKIGGLNDQELKIAFNDVDYCLRVREAGYLVVYTPYALLHHYESKSRGYEDTPEKQARFNKEVLYMQKRHAALLARGDPYYNPQLLLTHSYQPNQSYADELPL